MLKAEQGDFKLVGVADRIDETPDKSAVIIDYKSGGTFSKKAMETGALPQLPLEALILKNGGFPEIGGRDSQSLQYWVFSGSGGGTITALSEDVEAITAQTADNLIHLINSYDDADMPYLSVPRPDQAPRFNDYEHLARIKEWSVSDDSYDEGNAA